MPLRSKNSLKIDRRMKFINTEYRIVVTFFSKDKHFDLLTAIFQSYAS